MDVALSRRVKGNSYPYPLASPSLMRGDRNFVRYNRHMAPTPEARRLRTAFELFEAGLRMMKARYRRSHPHASPAEIESMLSAWLLQRPGAQSGDAKGRSITLPRSP
jgi:hypothetical protein